MIDSAIIKRICQIALQRKQSCFQPDIEAHREALQEAIRGKSFLVAGGAGYIGSGFVRELAAYRPEKLHIIDHSENGIVDLVRFLRGTREFKVPNFRTFSLDYGSPLIAPLIESQGAYDAVFSFAAYKHVRSERDPYSAYQLLETNLIKGASFFRQTALAGIPHLFSVSTDKAANPVSLMGASKRVMESLLMLVKTAWSPDPANFSVYSARFANVAFSTGSLPQGWLKWMVNRQPLAAPSDIERYFITQQEAAQLCLLAAFIMPQGHIAIPRVDTNWKLINLKVFAEITLQELGFQPFYCQNEEEAFAVFDNAMAKKQYPCVFLPSETSGEKHYEEFVAADEIPIDCTLNTLQMIALSDKLTLDQWRAFRQDFRQLPLSDDLPEKMLGLLRSLCPQFQHKASPYDLDQRL